MLGEVCKYLSKSAVKHSLELHPNSKAASLERPHLKTNCITVAKAAPIRRLLQMRTPSMSFAFGGLRKEHVKKLQENVEKNGSWNTRNITWPTLPLKADSSSDAECSECRVDCVNLQCETEEPVQKQKKVGAVV